METLVKLTAMKIRTKSLEIACFVVLMFFACAALSAESLPVPAPPKFDASSYVLMDFGSGAVLADHNSNERLTQQVSLKL